ncbi:PAS domain S-box protein [Leptospira inadai serovar Lyme str. 10]|uniref:histidine kinase n=2 Tax=Leptospira inadai serovar Lyme TaxID=293084 RepID=V6HBW9_9LEPT|nr:MHYT domain-containing protein [Leptospira inadai]EQA37241.1 PAS domain S-box protein [Leptospira inadai serovar Lyme str. 10]PNV73590.1 transcriptional regulator [Leptospira inadai serovar Lyme]
MNETIRQFFLSDQSAPFLDSSYDPGLIVLSILVAIFSSYIALRMVGQPLPESISPASRFLILFAAGIALGCGVWSMHFIGMLSFKLCTNVTYDRTLTIVSVLPSIVASMVALTYVSRSKLRIQELIIGGVLVGSGIGSMHYTGMAAMRMNASLRYDPWIFALSILVAVVLSILSLWIRFGLQSLRLTSHWPTLISGSVMGIAISGMHYTGMAAARFIGVQETVTPNNQTDPMFLALAVSVITIGFTLFTFAVNAFFMYRKLVNNLKESEARMRAIISTAVDGVITIDTRGRIIDFNKSAERIFGYTNSELLGKNIQELMPEPYHSGQGAILKNYIRTGTTKIIGTGREALGRRKDGSIFPARLAIGHVKLPREVLFVSFVTDISERKMIETALKQSEQQVRSLIQNIPGITYRCLLNEDWTTLYMSDAVESMTGYPVSEFLPPNPIRSYKDIIHPQDQVAVYQAVQEAVREKRAFALEYRIIHRNGEIRWFWENGSAISGSSGDILFLEGVILDITERHNMEEDLRTSKEKAELASVTKTSFLANMSHEIRTPMNSILGFTEVLLSGKLGKDQRTHLETVKASAKSLLRLLNDILNTAKLEKGAVELESVGFSLFRLIGELKSFLGISAIKKRLDFEVIQDPELSEFYRGDSLRIRQILINLIGNAIKFTDKGKVTLRIEKSGNELHFSVIDTGIGIRADRLDKIFEPFTQADVSTTRRFGGTGLGTTICKQLTELMGGKIWAESRLGEGSTFHVLIPLRKIDGPKTEIKKSVRRNIPSLNILVVDDIEQNTELVELLLKNEGHRVSSAYNGEEAFNKVQSDKFDLILMDVQMPVLDGLQATRVIRHYEIEENVPRIPILALTASVFEEDRNSAKDAGMDGFISKPIDFNQMMEEITRVMNLSGAITPSPSKVAKNGTGSSSNSERAEELIRLLFDSFQKGAIEDRDIDELISLLSGEIEETKLEELVTKIEQFEFEAAQRILQELTRSLGITGV